MVQSRSRNEPPWPSEGRGAFQAGVYKLGGLRVIAQNSRSGPFREGTLLLVRHSWAGPYPIPTLAYCNLPHGSPGGGARRRHPPLTAFSGARRGQARSPLHAGPALQWWGCSSSPPPTLAVVSFLTAPPRGPLGREEAAHSAGVPRPCGCACSKPISFSRAGVSRHGRELGPSG